MKRMLIFLLVCALGLSAAWAMKTLPADESGLVREKYAGWTGVLRVWVLADWEIGDGSIESWLNFCANGFEKSRSGVRVSVKAVDERAMREMRESGVNPPDIVIFPPGIFSTDEYFRDIDVKSELRRGLWDGGRAVPIAVSVCAWAWSAARLTALPGDMAAVKCACPAKNLGATVCLSSGLRPEEGAGRSIGGVDLGLAAESEPQKTPEAGVKCTLGEGFSVDDRAINMLKSGEIDAAVADMHALASLAEDGFAISLTGSAAYADSAAFAAILDKDSPSAPECARFVDYILADGQTSVSRAGALGAAEGAWAWQNTYLSPLEISAAGMEFIAPAPFSDAERFTANVAAGGFITGEITADAALARMRQ